MSRQQTIEDLRRKTQAVLDTQNQSEWLLSPSTKSRSANRIKSGSRKNDREHNDGEEAISEKTAFTRVLELVSFQECCSQKLLDKLSDEGYSRDEAMQAIERATGYGYVSDTRYGQMLARKRSVAGKGQVFVSRELRALGIDPNTLPGWPFDYFGSEEDQYEKALDLLEKHPPHCKDLYAGACRKLVSRGYSSALSSRAAKAWIRGYTKND